MEDSKIIALFWRRDESALKELENSVGKLCLRAAREITGDSLDAEECFSDTCLARLELNPARKTGFSLRLRAPDLQEFRAECRQGKKPPETLGDPCRA